MIGFLAPWTWAGALCLALPIAVHLLRRHRAPRRAFPTLRFLPSARVVAVRRHRLTDIPLLLIRLMVLAAAILALAQPVWRGAAGRADGGSSGVARAVIVDRSAAMQSISEGGQRAAERADAVVTALAPAATQVVVEASDLRAGLRQAAGWIARQHGTREVVMVSTFPEGSVSRSDLDMLPAGVGFRTSAIDVRPGPPPVPALPPAAEIDWRSASPNLAAARAAAADAGLVPRAADQPVIIALPDAPDREAVVGHARSIDRPWMYEAIRAIADDAPLRSAARSTTAVAAPIPQVFTPVATDAGGGVLLAAAATGSPSSLLLLANAPAGTLFTVALTNAVTQATRAEAPGAHGTPAISGDELLRWERPAMPGDSTVPATDGRALGRWGWIAALAWLGVETWLRRRPDAAAVVAPVVNERVA